MAGPNIPQGGNDSVIKNYIKRNIYIKLFIIYFIIFAILATFLYLVSGTDLGLELAKTFNKIIFIISGIFSFIPIYNYWTSHFNAYIFYLNYSYELDYNFLQSNKFYTYLFKFYMESIPLLLANLFFLKKFVDLRNFFKNYYSTLKYRNLKVIDNPVKKLEKGLYTEGVDNNDYNEFQIKYMNQFYIGKNKDKNKDNNLSPIGIIEVYKTRLKKNIENYYQSLKKLELELKNEKEWNKTFEKIINNQKQPYDLLHLFIYKNIDYYLLEKKDLENLKIAFSWNLHFKWNNEKKMWVSREFFIDSLNKEVTPEELYNYYYTTFLFWINKQWTNFPMYIYVHNLDVPLEWKKLNKWVDGLNAPGKTEIILGKKGNKLILKTVDLYYRLYMFRNYLGIECEYMTKFIQIIDEKFGVK